MHPVISEALRTLPTNTETPRTGSYDIPESFTVKDMLFNVHIRIKTPGYGPLSGTGSVMFVDDASRESFYSQMDDLMALAGMEKDGGWFYPSDGSRSTYVHAHPDDLSGVLSTDQINAINAGLMSGEYGSTIRWIDVYEVHESISDDEAQKRIEHYEPEIRDTILRRHETTRKTKFVRADLVKLLTALPGMGFSGEKALGGYREAIPTVILNKLEDIRESLIREGWLNAAEMNGERYYRTANKTEQRARGLLKKQAA